MITVISNKMMKMREIFFLKMKIFTLVLAVAFTCACSKFDSGVKVYDEPEFPVCLSPVSIETFVKYDEVTLRCRVFRDAREYEMEIFSYDVTDVEEPDADKLVMSLKIPSDAIPYKFKAPEESKLYFRIRALNEAKRPSKWVYGSFETGTDPSTICSKPTDAKAAAVFEKVTFSWTTYPDTEIYELEVYDESIPDSGDPEASSLVQKFELKAAQIPFTYTFDPGKNYYFRVRATAPSTALRNSNWVKGMFMTAKMSWPKDEGALDFSLSSAWTASINSEKFSGYNSGQVVPEGGIEVDKVTYGNGIIYYGDRVQIPCCYNWDETTYSVKMPLKRYISFKINRPGTLSFIPYTSGKPTIVLAIVAKKAGETYAKYLYEIKSSTSFPQKNDEKNRQTLEVKEDDLYGIEEAATIYLFSNAGGFHCYPLTWTPSIPEE